MKNFAKVFLTLFVAMWIIIAFISINIATLTAISTVVFPTHPVAGFFLVCLWLSLLGATIGTLMHLIG